MQKDYLNNKKNSSLIFNTKPEENFEKIFSLVFQRYDNLEEEEEFEDRIYFYENLLLYKPENLFYKDKLEKNIKEQKEELYKVKEREESINNLKKQLINNNDLINSINSDKKENQIIIINNGNKEELSSLNNDKKMKINEKIKDRKGESHIVTKTWIRGPYKKKTHAIIKAKVDDKCFPFTTGKGLINTFYDDSSKSDKYNDIQSIKEDSYLKLANNTFIINRYAKDSEGKIKKSKKQRKFKSDDIRKKIKSNCHKIIKNIINENLKKAGSEEFFGFLPQSFLGNVSKIFNKKYMNSTYEDLLSIDFSKNQKTGNLEIDQKNYNKNINVLNYLEKNPEISKISGFYKIKKMKYKDILNSYFLSKEFENTIDMLKNKNETSEYIIEYIFLAKKYINFFSN